MHFNEIDLDDRVKNSHVLIVDDAAFNRTIIEEMLRLVGMKYISGVASGAECLEQLDSTRTDIIILDLMMPEMDGFECIERIRNHPQHNDLPIIVQTAMGDADERLKSFQRGANDLITKPINPYELVSRIRQHLNYRNALRDLENYRARVQEELSLARALQQSMLPTPENIDALHHSHNIAVSSFAESSSELGGDLWGIRPISRTKTAIWMFDISGHGVAAAINAVRVHTLFEANQLQIYSPGQLLEMLNEHLCDRFHPGEFSTFFLGLVDIEADMLHYAVAASTEALVHDHASNSIYHLKREGFPLGVKTGAPYPDYTLPFHAQDTLMIYSDALTETNKTEHNSFLQLDEIADTLKQHMHAADAPLKQRQQRMVDAMLKKIGVTLSDTLEDDLTLVMLSRDRA